MGRRKYKGGDDEPILGLDDLWESPIVIFGVLSIGLFIVSIIVWSVLNYSKVKISNIWISLLIAMPITVLLNELLVGNALWRTNDDSGKSLRLSSIPVTLFKPLNIFGEKGVTQIHLWLPNYWFANVFIIWWGTFLGLSYIRK